MIESIMSGICWILSGSCRDLAGFRWAEDFVFFFTLGFVGFCWILLGTYAGLLMGMLGTVGILLDFAGQ